jgi:hypothetical protein
VRVEEKLPIFCAHFSRLFWPWDEGVRVHPSLPVAAKPEKLQADEFCRFIQSKLN